MKKCNIQFRKRQNREVSEEYCIPQGEILRLRSRTRLRLQFAKTPCCVVLPCGRAFFSLHSARRGTLRRQSVLALRH